MISSRSCKVAMNKIVLNRAYRILFVALVAMNSAYGQGMGGGMGGGTGGPPQPPPIPDVEVESLIFSVPDKWYPFSRSTENKDETYIFPTGDDPQDWKRAYRIEQFFTTLGFTEAKQVFDLKTQANSKSCQTHDVTREPDVLENGYSTAQWTETCGLADDETQVTMTKAIVGAERLYLVSMIWKDVPGRRDVEQWVRRFRQVFVCDPNTGTNPCQYPNGPESRGDGGRP